MAGLWDVWTTPDGEVIDSCTIVTRAAEGSVAELHNRVPLVLLEDVPKSNGFATIQTDGWVVDFDIEPIAAIPGKAPPRQLGLFG